MLTVITHPGTEYLLCADWNTADVFRIIFSWREPSWMAHRIPFPLSPHPHSFRKCLFLGLQVLVHSVSNHANLKRVPGIHEACRIEEQEGRRGNNYSLVLGTSDNLCNGFWALIESLFPPCLNFNYAAIIFTNLCKRIIWKCDTWQYTFT